ncbi:MAG: formate dehydrogenase subunit alpha [Rhodobacteraceae bacterium]|nr:formate dehydrogenase subunit alpha [Paracoccaceae bacterium]
MANKITFTLDGQEVSAEPGQTIWEVTKGQGFKIPHLCHKDSPGYRSDGNCRLCMVEIEGERTLAASCIREPRAGMVVNTRSERAEKARSMVMETLVADQPAQTEAHDRSAHFWDMAEAVGVETSRMPTLEKQRVPLLDDSHMAMKVNLDACISCNLCVRACREVQVNDVIGMAGRGHDSKIVFDFDDPMGASTCVACGECVQACPTGALMPASIVDDATQIGDSKAYDREVKSVCPYCGVGCQLSFKLKKDETGQERIAYVEGVEGPANENRLCVKGRFGFDYVGHSHRLTKPLIRKPDAPAKGLNVDPSNPWTHFREASWEEALDAAAGGMMKLRDEAGGGSISGLGSAKCSNEEAYLFQKLIRTAFGHNNVDHCTRLCHASSVAALMENVGSGAVTATFNEIENADCAIVIGANPTENHPVAATYFKQFTKRGGTLIVMDPRGQGLKRHATHMLQFRPGADVAMLNAIMHVIVEEALYDRQYIEGFTEGFEQLREHVKGFPPEKMQEICGISAEKLREVARAFATAERSMIFWGMGISQHIHGTDNSRCLISLALLCGHVGRPGTGLHPLRGQNNVQGASDAGLIPMVLPDYQPVVSQEARDLFSSIWNGAEIPEKPGLTTVEMIDAIDRGEILSMYILGENPAMSDPDVEHARKALSKLRHLVVQDIFITETANFADVILPASAWPEKNGTVTNTNRQVQMGRKALEAPGEAKEDWWITVELAKRLGLEWTYVHPSEVFAEMKMGMPSLNNITWNRLETDNAVTYPSLTPEDPGQAVVFGDGFPRAGGRAKFTPAEVTPPAEVPDAEYPMILTTGRMLEHWHTGSMTRRAGVLDWAEPEATAALHPKTLADMGIEPGEVIRVLTRRGAIDLAARADSAVARDMVFIPFAFVEAAANVLTNPQLDPYGKIPEFKFAACRVMKTDGLATMVAAE